MPNGATSTLVARTATPAGRAARGLADLVYLAPVLILLGVLIVLPTVSVFRHSFTDWQPGYASPWVGSGNYTELVRSSQFQEILHNEAILLLGVPLWTIVPFVIAVLLYDGVPAPAAFRTVLFFPATVAPAVIGILFGFILAPTGPLDAGLRAIGLGSLAQNWLADDAIVKPVIIVVLAWATVGTGVVIFSAGLGAVAPELFEAAQIDGAGWWQRLWHVAVPSLRRVIELWVVILVVTLFIGVFPWIYTLTRGGPGSSSTTIDFDVYQNALTYGYFGLAAAEAVILLFLVGLIVAVGVGLSRLRGRFA